MKAIQVSSSNGTAYGHVPGHKFRDVDVTITRTRRGMWTVEVLETWGCNQGKDIEDGRKKVIGRHESLREAVSIARQASLDAGIHQEYLGQSLSQASAEAVKEADAADQPERKAYSYEIAPGVFLSSPVLVIDGKAYGPCDDIPDAMRLDGARGAKAGYWLAWRLNGEEETTPELKAAADAFLSQWPDESTRPGVV